MIGLLKAIHTRPMKAKQHGPHRYTDPQGRVWDWDPVAKKYVYVSKTGSAPAAATDKDKRNQAIIDDYQGGMSLKELAEKYKLSNARVYGITRGRSTTSAKIKSGAIASNERVDAYNSSPSDAQVVADTVGILPVGPSATAYMKSNLQSIFKTSAKEVQYLKGVNVADPLGGLGAWMVDDSLVNNAIEALKECIAELKDEDSDYYKSLRRVDVDEVRTKMEEHLTNLQKIVKDREVLDTIHAIVGDKPDPNKPLDISKMGYFPFARTSVDCLLGVTLSPGEIEESMVQGNQLSPKMKEFLDALGMSEEGWKKRNWSQEVVYSVFMACMFPDESKELMDRWLTPREYTKTSIRTGLEVKITGGQGNQYPLLNGRTDDRTSDEVLAPAYQANRGRSHAYNALLSETERWTADDFLKASKKVQSLFPETAKFFKDNFKLDTGSFETGVRLPPEIDPKKPTSYFHDSFPTDIETVTTKTGPVKLIPMSMYYHRGALAEKVAGAFKGRSFTDDLKGKPAAGLMLKEFQNAFDANTSRYEKNHKFFQNPVNDYVYHLDNMNVWRDRIVEGVQKNVEMWKTYAPSKFDKDIISSWHVLNQHALIDKIAEGSPELGIETNNMVAYEFNLGKSMASFAKVDPVDAARLFPTTQPASIKVDKVYSTGYRRGGHTGGHTGSTLKFFRDDYALARRSGLKTAHKDDWIHYGRYRGTDAVRAFFLYSLGANYHARKMVKHYKGATKFVWPKGKPKTDFWEGKGPNQEAFKEAVANTRSSMLTRQITRGKGGTVTGHPDAILSDVSLDEYKRIAAKIGADHDIVEHGNFKIKINGIYKIGSRMESVFKEAESKYGNVKHELYHGTSFMSGVPILRGGYKLIKGKTASGRRVWRSMGDGLYLADQSSKSAQYIGGDFSRHGTHGVLFLNDVAMGVVSDNQFDANSNTVFGAKGTRWKNNEWAVKDPKAVIPRYWIDVESM